MLPVYCCKSKADGKIPKRLSDRLYDFSFLFVRTSHLDKADEKE